MRGEESSEREEGREERSEEDLKGRAALLNTLSKYM